MKTIKEFFAHPIIQMALVLGAVTVILAYVSKRVLDEPLRNWELALPALLASLWQGLAMKLRGSRIGATWVGMLVVVVAAGLVVLRNL